jgi:hypothetical protein
VADRPSGAMDCFDAFRWPLPVSFASAVFACRFEQGDVLYPDSRAYDGWSGRVSKGLRAIQVLEPPRSARGTPLEGDSDRRRANWASSVRISLIDLGSGECEECVLSQGKLAMALWRGDEGWLDAERAEPDFPRTARELHGNLDQARGAAAKRFRNRRSQSGTQFILVVDLANDASCAKAALVKEQLSAAGAVEVADLSPGEAGIESPDAYHPTLVLRVFSLADRGQDSVEAELRACLYQGGSSRRIRDESDALDADASSGDRFSVGRHGLLVAI